MLSRKMKGYNLQQPHCTSSSLSHSLSLTITYHFYNAIIQYTTILQWIPFINGIPWENTMGFSKPWVYKSPIIDQFMTMKLQHFTRHFFPKFSLQGNYPRTPFWGGISPTPPPVRCWDPNTVETITSLN